MIAENMHPLTLPIRKSQNLRLLVHTRLEGQHVSRWRKPEFGTASGIWFVSAGGKIHPIISFKTTVAKYPTFICGRPIKIPKSTNVRPSSTRNDRISRYMTRPDTLLIDVLIALERVPKPDRELIAAYRKFLRERSKPWRLKSRPATCLS